MSAAIETAPPPPAPQPAANSALDEAFSGIDHLAHDVTIEAQSPAPAPTPEPAPAAPKEPEATIVPPPPKPDEKPKPAPQDDFGLDKLVEKPKPAKEPAKEEAKPAKPSKEEGSLKQFREQYELTKKERDELASKLATLEQAKAEGTKREIEEATKALKSEMEAIKKRAEETETTLKYVSYERSPEFRQKWVEPLNAAWDEVKGDIAGIKLTDPDGTERDADVNDVVKLLQMPAAKAAIVAQEMFGPAAPVILGHRATIQKLWTGRQNAINEYKAKGAEWEAQRTKQIEEQQNRAVQVFSDAVSSFESQYPTLFSKPEDPVEAEQFDKGQQLVDMAFKGAGLDGTPEADRMTMIARAQAAVATRARSFGAQRAAYLKLKAEYDELKAKLDKVAASEPGQGSDNAGSPKKELSPEDQIDLLPEA